MIQKLAVPTSIQPFLVYQLLLKHTSIRLCLFFTVSALILSFICVCFFPYSHLQLSPKAAAISQAEISISRKTDLHKFGSFTEIFTCISEEFIILKKDICTQ